MIIMDKRMIMIKRRIIIKREKEQKIDDHGQKNGHDYDYEPSWRCAFQRKNKLDDDYE